jgi:membrane-associated phospholipid phosphatase
MSRPGLGFLPWAIDSSPDAPKSGPPIATIAAIASAGYPAEDWDPALRATDAVLELAQGVSPLTTAIESNTKWTGVADIAAFWTAVSRPAATLAELELLQTLMLEDREHYLEEALAQADAAPQYYTSMLDIPTGKKPWTKALMSYLVRSGEFVALKYKMRFNRPRPSTFDPGLIPPYGPPGHAAFPSGHSLQMHLLSFVLLQISGIAARLGPKPASWTNDLRQNEPVPLAHPSALIWLAIRIARNRERLGLHFESDSIVGRQIAVSMAEFLMKQWAAIDAAYTGASAAAKAAADAALLANRMKLADGANSFSTVLGLAAAEDAWVAWYRLLTLAGGEWSPPAMAAPISPTT